MLRQKLIQIRKLFLSVNTANKSFVLSAKILHLIPFILLSVIGEFLINQYFGKGNTYAAFNITLIDFYVTHAISFIFSLILLVNVIIRLQENQFIDYVKIIKKSFKDLGPVLLITVVTTSLTLIPTMVIYALLVRHIPVLKFFYEPDVFLWVYCISAVFSSIYKVATFNPLHTKEIIIEPKSNLWIILTLIAFKLGLVLLFRSFLPVGADEASNIVFLPIAAYLIVVINFNHVGKAETNKVISQTGPHN